MAIHFAGSFGRIFGGGKRNNSKGRKRHEVLRKAVAEALEKRQLLTVTAASVTPLCAAVEGSSVSFGLSASSDDSSISSFVVSWGDGSSDTLGGDATAASHIYTNFGSYAVAATASDGDPSSLTSDPVTIAVADAPISAVGNSGLSATVGASWSDTVATFTDGDSSETGSHLSATVAWSDGITDSASLLVQGGGVFGVIDSRVFSSAGGLSATVTVNDAGGSTASATSSISIANASFSVGGGSLAVQEGSTYTGSVGSLADSNPFSSASNFSATYSVNGVSYPATVDGSGGYYSLDVSGIGPFNLSQNSAAGTVTVSEGTDSHGANGVLAVADAPLSLSGNPNLAVTVNAAWSDTVATLTDGDASEDGSDLSASVAWADGVTTAGTLVAQGGGVFSIVTSRTFSATGGVAATVNVQDSGGSTASAAIGGSASVAYFSTGGGGFSAQEGSAYTGSVGTLTDSNPNSSPGNFFVTYTFNGNSYAVSVDGYGGNYSLDVSGIGPFTLSASGSQGTVSVTEAGVTQTASGNVGITDAPLSASGNPSLSATVGQAWSDTVATVYDANTSETGSDLSATVYWSDGQTDAAALSPQGNGIFSAVDSRTFNSYGSVSANVVISDTGSAGTSATASANVAAAPISVGGGSFSVQEGSPFTGSVGTLIDSNPNSLASNFSVSYYFNGGWYSLSVDGSGGNYLLDISNFGPFSLSQNQAVGTIYVSETGLSGFSSGAVNITDAPLSLSGNPSLTPTVNSIWSDTVATLTDTYTGETGSDLAASVAWADGMTTAGTLVAQGGGVFNIVTSRSFTSVGNVSATVTVNDAGGNIVTTSIGGSATVPAYSVGGGGFTAAEGSAFTGSVGSLIDSNPNSAASNFSASYILNGVTYAVSINGSGGNYSLDVSGVGPLTLAAGGSQGTLSVSEAGTSTSALGTVSITDPPLYVSGNPWLSATVGQSWNGIVGTVSDTFTGETGANLSGTIAWSDGITDTATLVAQGNGNFNIMDARMFNSAGSLSALVTLNDAGGSSAPTTSYISVANAAFSVGGGSLSVQEGTPFTGSVGNISDTNPNSVAWNFSANYYLNGVYYPVSVDGTGGNYSLDVTGIGPFTLGQSGAAGWVTVFEGSDSRAANGTLGVTDAPLSLAGNAGISPNVNSNWSETVATLTDGDPLEDGSDLSSNVVWSDGVTTAGTLVAQGNGVFNIVTSRMFTSVSAISATVNVYDTGGSTTTATISTSTSVYNFSVGGGGFSVQEGSTFTGSVGSLSDSNPNSSASNFSASYILNGVTYAVTINGSGGNYSLDVYNLGPFTLADSGRTGTISVTEVGVPQSAGGSLSVTDAPLTAYGVSTISATVGQNWNGVVATVTDGYSGETGANLSTTVYWSDGRTDAGTLVPQGNGNFNITDTRIFTTDGTVYATVVINDIGGASTTASSSGSVAIAPFTVAGDHITVQEGNTFTGSVGSINDTNPYSTPGNFTASFYFGGNTYPATIDAGFSVNVSNIGPFAPSDNGTQGTVYVTESGTQQTAGTSISVTDAPLSATGNTTITATVGQNWSGTVATLTDTYTGETAADLSATVAWSDGVTDNGTLVNEGGGVFFITDARIFNTPGSISANVTITDSVTGSTPATATASGTVNLPTITVHSPGDQRFAAGQVLTSYPWGSIDGFVPGGGIGYSAATTLSGISLAMDNSGNIYASGTVPSAGDYPGTTTSVTQSGGGQSDTEYSSAYDVSVVAPVITIAGGTVDVGVNTSQDVEVDVYGTFATQPPVVTLDDSAGFVTTSLSSFSWSSTGETAVYTVTGANVGNTVLTATFPMAVAAMVDANVLPDTLTVDTNNLQLCTIGANNSGNVMATVTRPKLNVARRLDITVTLGGIATTDVTVPASIIAPPGQPTAIPVQVQPGAEPGTYHVDVNDARGQASTGFDVTVYQPDITVADVRTVVGGKKEQDVTIWDPVKNQGIANISVDPNNLSPGISTSLTDPLGKDPNSEVTIQYTISDGSGVARLFVKGLQQVEADEPILLGVGGGASYATGDIYVDPIAIRIVGGTGYDAATNTLTVAKGAYGSVGLEVTDAFDGSLISGVQLTGVSSNTNVFAPVVPAVSSGGAVTITGKGGIQTGVIQLTISAPASGPSIVVNVKVQL